MKSLLALLVAAVVVVIFFTLGGSRRERDDRAEIQQLVDRYYDALRNQRYDEAASYYESTTFVGTGINPPVALRQATELSGGVPAKVIVDALRIDGDRAVCELLIERQGQGPVSYVMKDENGKVLGTWARRLHFVRENESWKIAKDGENGDGADTKKAMDMLQQIQRQQQQQRQKLQQQEQRYQEP